MDKEALVYADLEGVLHLVGRLWARVPKNRESATFEYDEGWLHAPHRPLADDMDPDAQFQVLPRPVGRVHRSLQRKPES